MRRHVTIPYLQDTGPEFTFETAIIEVERCLLCLEAPCSAACLAGADPAYAIRALREGNVKEAIHAIRTTNPLAGSCAHVCSCGIMCEKACVLEKPIQIGKLQQFIVDLEKQQGPVLELPLLQNGKKIVCIGAGPASLTCASVLARNGYSVTVYEAKEKAGGILSHAVSPHRLPQHLIDSDIQRIADLGVNFIFNHKIDAAEVATLRREYDAVFIGIGLWKGSKLDIARSHFNGVMTALEYLQHYRTSADPEFSRQVVVIGGGEVAMDCAIAAKQRGADKVSIVYRRTLGEAPASKESIIKVFEHGIPMYTDFAPIEVLGTHNRVEGVNFCGRDAYSELTLKADLVLFAIGQEKEEGLSPILPGGNVFFGGDYAKGKGNVATAVADGKAGAQAIMQYLGAQ